MERKTRDVFWLLFCFRTPRSFSDLNCATNFGSRCIQGDAIGTRKSRVEPRHWRWQLENEKKTLLSLLPVVFVRLSNWLKSHVRSSRFARARSRDGRISIDKRFKEIAVGVSFQLNYLPSGIRDRDCVRFADFQSFPFNRLRLLFFAGFLFCFLILQFLVFITIFCCNFFYLFSMVFGIVDASFVSSMNVVFL